MLRVQPRPSSSESASELDAAAREDLARLQRGYRVKEKERKTEGDQSQYTLRKQQSMIESLQAENADLKKNLSLAGSRQNELKSQLVREKFDELLSHQRQYKESVAEEEKATEILDQKIRDLERDIAQQRKHMGGVHGGEQQHGGLQKQLRVMENRLEKSSVRFNSSLATNSQLRMKIDHLRQEKAVFEGIHKKLQKELLSCKRNIGEVIEASTQGYDSRDEAQTKLLSLKEKADKEVAQYEMEVKELQRQIDYDRKLRDFMNRKNQERAEAHMEIEARKMRKEVEKTSTRERTVLSYEQAFEKIKKATGITDIDQLVSKFIDVEDQNFALFNFVNELNAEIETVRDKISQVTEEIEKFKGQGVEMEEKRRAILRDLEAELARVEEEAGEFERRFKTSTATVEQLLTGVDSVFTKTGCDSSAITSLLGGHSGVTETTILQYLGVVEQKTNELLQLQAFIKAKESGDPEQ
ncbi:Outer dynein arm protein 1 [Geodia barretti]|uniref:Outer dynein arm protein 1 n=1 Tax=Geodia barretti TaxID=519541 RepID=A0AA35W9F9_GEOBA|nr:Outer dynein arm protein 1 [Geodia barretti]